MSIFERQRPIYSELEQIERAHQARRLLADPILTEAFDEAEWSLVQGWADQRSTKEEREARWAALHYLEIIRNNLRTIIADGEFAAAKQ
jgi:hypothetical protein